MLKGHRRHAAGACGRLMLGNSLFRNKKLSILKKNTENFLEITKFTEIEWMNVHVIWVLEGV